MVEILTIVRSVKSLENSHGIQRRLFDRYIVTSGFSDKVHNLATHISRNKAFVWLASSLQDQDGLNHIVRLARMNYRNRDAIFL
jgi:hypothetical protein